MLAWLAAWNRFEWFETVQAVTFTPLWLSFILITNALTYRQIGRCLLINNTRYYIWPCFSSVPVFGEALSPLTALFRTGFTSALMTLVRDVILSMPHCPFQRYCQPF